MTGFSQWSSSRDVANIKRVKKTMASNSRPSGASAVATKLGEPANVAVRALAVKGSARVQFPVLIRRLSGSFPRRPPAFRKYALRLGLAEPGICPTTFNPFLCAYEDSLQTSGCSAPAAYSQPDQADGPRPRGAVVSRRVAQTPAHGPRVVPGRGRPGAQARTRRLLNSSFRSVGLIPDDGMRRPNAGRETA